VENIGWGWQAINRRARIGGGRCAAELERVEMERADVLRIDAGEEDV
jgi:hypothetical protein